MASKITYYALEKCVFLALNLKPALFQLAAPKKQKRWKPVDPGVKKFSEIEH